MHIRLLYKKVLCVFMSLMIVVASTQSAFAASPAGWTATAADVVMAGATATITAFKGSGSSAVKAVITHKPTAIAVGKEIVKGGGALALAYAMAKLLDAGVDWVLDPANNRIKYTVAGTADPDSITPANKYIWSAGAGAPIDYSHATPQAAARVVCSFYNQIYGEPYKIADTVYFVPCKGDGYTDTWDVMAIDNPVYDPTYNPSAPVEKYLPVSDLAPKVIANAEAGHAESQDLVKAVAVGEANTGELDIALDAAAQPTTDNPTADPDAPPVDTPAFDPSSIIAAIASIGAILGGIFTSLTGFVDWWQEQWSTFSTAITDVTDWAMAEPAPLEPEPVLVDDGSSFATGWQEKVNAGYVQFGGQCPADVLIPMSYMGASTNLSISYVPFCHFASIIRYAVIMGAWIGALMIISGGRSRE